MLGVLLKVVVRKGGIIGKRMIGYARCASERSVACRTNEKGGKWKEWRTRKPRTCLTLTMTYNTGTNKTLL